MFPTVYDHLGFLLIFTQIFFKTNGVIGTLYVIMCAYEICCHDLWWIFFLMLRIVFSKETYDVKKFLRTNCLKYIFSFGYLFYLKWIEMGSYGNTALIKYWIVPNDLMIGLLATTFLYLITRNPKIMNNKYGACEERRAEKTYENKGICGFIKSVISFSCILSCIWEFESSHHWKRYWFCCEKQRNLEM